jgi:hypothetical protein
MTLFDQAVVSSIISIIIGRFKLIPTNQKVIVRYLDSNGDAVAARIVESISSTQWKFIITKFQ